jgi:hypothetical protein
MSQPIPPEQTSLTKAETPSSKPDDQSKLSNGVWESIKHDYIKPLSWAEGNILAPLYNEAIVKPVNTVIDKAETLNIPISKLETAAVPDAGVASAGFYAQQMASAAGNLGWQLGVGAIVGKYMRVGGEALALKAEAGEFKIATASTIRNFASSRTFANVAGATLYGAAIDPEQGQSRIGNGLTAGGGMLLFEGANKVIGTDKFLDARAMGLRAVTGAPIGVTQQFFSTLIGTGHADFDPTHYDKAAASGAFMNVMLPGAMKGIDAIAPKVGLHAYADRFAEQQHKSALASLNLEKPAEPGSWADPKAASLAIAAGRIDITTRARSSATEETSIDHTKGLITLKNGDSPSQFIEENAHIKIARDPKFEEGFANAAKLLADEKPEEARQQYLKSRIAEEVEAHRARNEAIQKTGAKFESTSTDPVAIAREYAGKFALEVDAFLHSKGQFRPEMSFSHGGGSVHAPNGTEFVQNVGIGPGVSHDGAPHTTGDSHTSLDDTQTGTRAVAVDRSDLLKDLPKKDMLVERPKNPGAPWVYTWPKGTRVLGHDNVQTLSFTGADLSEIVLTKIDPLTKQVASMVRNYAEGQPYKLPDGTVLFKYNEWEQNLHTKHNIFQVEKGGAWSLPEKSTWATYPGRISLEIAGQPVWVDSILYHNNASGEVDYALSGVPTILTETATPKFILDSAGHEDWLPGQPVPLGLDGNPQFLLYQRSQTHTDKSVTDFVYDPRKLDPNFPRNQLMPDSSIDSFTASNPLATSIGNFDNVHRMADQLRYRGDDQGKIVRFGGDKLAVETYKAGEAPTLEYLDSIKEKYPKGRDTIWGRAVEMEIKPKSMVVTLENGGTVEIYNSVAYPDGAPSTKLNADGTVDERFANNRFGNVRRVDTAPPTKDIDGNSVPGEITLVKEIKTSEGTKYSNIRVPAHPEIINGLPVMQYDAIEEFPGPTMSRTFYLSDAIGPNSERIPYGTIDVKLNGFTTDLLQNGPFDAVWRYERGASYLKQVPNGVNNWTMSSIIYEDANTQVAPQLIINNDVMDNMNSGNKAPFTENDLWIVQNGKRIPKPLLTENYPFGQPTPWGTAVYRSSFYNGLALVGMKDGTQVIIDAKGQFLDRLPAKPAGQ